MAIKPKITFAESFNNPVLSGANQLWQVYGSAEVGHAISLKNYAQERYTANLNGSSGDGTFIVKTSTLDNGSSAVTSVVGAGGDAGATSVVAIGTQTSDTGIIAGQKLGSWVFQTNLDEHAAKFLKAFDGGNSSLIYTPGTHHSRAVGLMDAATLKSYSSIDGYETDNAVTKVRLADAAGKANAGGMNANGVESSQGYDFGRIGDALVFHKATDLLDAHFGIVHNFQSIVLTGASTVELGEHAKSAGIGSDFYDYHTGEFYGYGEIVTGAGNTKVSTTTDFDAPINVDARLLGSDKTLRLMGDNDFHVFAFEDRANYTTNYGSYTENLLTNTAPVAPTGVTIVSQASVALQALNSNIVGGRGDDVIEGSAGRNILDGGLGQDTVSYEHSAQSVAVNLARGSSVSGGITDILKNFENVIGSSNDDTLVGNYKSNRLTGGEGIDSLTGGLGADSFVLSTSCVWDASGAPVSANSNFARIIDFSSSQGDKIIINSTTLPFLDGMGQPLVDAPANWFSTTNPESYIYYDQSTGELFYDKDAGAWDHAEPICCAPCKIAVLENHSALSASDFVLAA